MSPRNAGRLYGITFLLSFLSYGVGSSWVDGMLQQPDSLATIAEQKSLFSAGIVSMALIHTLLNFALPMWIKPFLAPLGAVRTTAYIALVLSATVILALGTLPLLSLIPLSELANQGESLTIALPVMLKSFSANAYQLGMALWGIGGLILCSLLLNGGIIPRALTLFGFVGYGVFFVGTVLELFGLPYGLLLSGPGGLFEVVLSLWLIFKGLHVSRIKIPTNGI